MGPPLCFRSALPPIAARSACVLQNSPEPPAQAWGQGKHSLTHHACALYANQPRGGVRIIWRCGLPVTASTHRGFIHSLPLLLGKRLVFHLARHELFLRRVLTIPQESGIGNRTQGGSQRPRPRTGRVNSFALLRSKKSEQHSQTEQLSVSPAKAGSFPSPKALHCYGGRLFSAL